MKIKVVTWNLRRARQNGQQWDIIRLLNADILTLQEVISIPNDILNSHSVIFEKATKKDGSKQQFGSAILVKGEIKNRFALDSDIEWVNNEIDFFSGNLICCKAALNNDIIVNIVSVYSPAWPISKERLKAIDVDAIKLIQNPELWVTELLWSGLKNQQNITSENWIVAGDFNSSTTFDNWSKSPRGNQEIIDRMNAIDLTECLYTSNGSLVPTFKNSNGGKIIHQIDHVYVSPPLLSCLDSSYVGDMYNIFEDSISDHLPIISDFDISLPH